MPRRRPRPPGGPEFVRAVLDAVESGDNEGARALVEPLHPADVADPIANLADLVGDQAAALMALTMLTGVLITRAQGQATTSNTSAL